MNSAVSAGGPMMKVRVTSMALDWKWYMWEVGSVDNEREQWRHVL